MPLLPANTNIGSLVFEGSNQSLSLNKYNLTINGSVSGTGKFVGSAAAGLTLNGSGDIGTLYFDETTDATTNVLDNLTITSGTVTLANTLIINYI
jgi:hypothetical protein